MILAEAELCKVTGYRRASAQARWLRRNGWRFTVNALGVPVVAVAEFNRHLVGGRAALHKPDYGAINGPA